MQCAQLNSFCNNMITRLDVDVLARLCTVPECENGDLLASIPPTDDSRNKKQIKNSELIQSYEPTRCSFHMVPVTG